MLTLNKTKAALPSCQCHYKELNQIQHTRPCAGGQSLTVPANTGALNFPQWGELFIIEIFGANNLHRWWKSPSNRVANLQLAACTRQVYAPAPRTHHEISPILGRLILNRGRNSAYRDPDIGYRYGNHRNAQRQSTKKCFGQTPGFGYRRRLSFKVTDFIQFLGVIVAHSTTFAASRELGSGQSFLSSLSQLYPAPIAHTIKITIIQSKGVLGINIFYSSNLALVFFRWRRLISLSKAATTNCPVLSPGSFNCSIAPAISCGTLAAIVCDLRLTALVAMLIHSLIGVQQYGRNKKSVQHLTCSTPLLRLVFNTSCCLNTNTAKPGSVTSTNRASYHKPLSEVTVMADNQSTQTRPKFTWRFLALNRHDKKARPCRLSVEAATEREARSILAPHFILSLAARLPAPEVLS